MIRSAWRTPLPADIGGGSGRNPLSARASDGKRLAQPLRLPPAQAAQFRPDPSADWGGTNGDAALSKACGRVSAAPRPRHMPMSGRGGDRPRAKIEAHEDGTAGVVGAETRDDAQTATILGLSGIDGVGDSLSSGRCSESARDEEPFLLPVTTGAGAAMPSDSWQKGCETAAKP